MSSSAQHRPPIHVVTAGRERRQVLERLWLLFRHDMSDYDGRLPFPDGTYRSERLESALTEPNWGAHLVLAGEAPVGFALTRSLDAEPFVLTSFFVVRGVRRSGVGRAALSRVLGTRPGRWAVAFQDDNRGAVRFWRAVAEQHDPDWAEERRAVPQRPDLPPDSWISFQVRT